MASPDPAAEIATLRTESARQQDKIKSLSRDRDSLQDELSRTASNIDALKARIKTLERENEAARKSAPDADKEAAVQQRLQTLEEEVKAKNREIKVLETESKKAAGEAEETLKAKETELDKVNRLLAAAKKRFDQNKVAIDELTRINTALSDERDKVAKDRDAVTAILDTMREDVRKLRAELVRVEQERDDINVEAQRLRADLDAALAVAASGAGGGAPPAPAPDKGPAPLNLHDELMARYEKEIRELQTDIQELSQERVKDQEALKTAIALRVTREAELREALLKLDDLQRKDVGNFDAQIAVMEAEFARKEAKLVERYEEERRKAAVSAQNVYNDASISVLPPVSDNGRPIVIVRARGPTRARIIERGAQEAAAALEARVDVYKRNAEAILNGDAGTDGPRQLNAIHIQFMRDYGGEIVEQQLEYLTWRFDVADDGLAAKKILPTLGFTDVSVIPTLDPTGQGRLVRVRLLSGSQSRVGQDFRQMTEARLIEIAGKELADPVRTSRENRARAAAVVANYFRQTGTKNDDVGILTGYYFSQREAAERAAFMMRKLGVGVRSVAEVPGEAGVWLLTLL